MHYSIDHVDPTTNLERFLELSYVVYLTPESSMDTVSSKLHVWTFGPDSKPGCGHLNIRSE